MADLQMIERALSVFCVPGQVVELRALGVGSKRAVCEVFGDMAALARRAAELDALGAAGVYFTPNPLRPDLAGVSASARKEDVSRRHWLLIDVDPERPPGTNSTEEEMRDAWDVLGGCCATLEGAGLTGGVIGTSGNGWHADYPIDLPNDEPSQATVKAVLKGLQERCGTPRARVDTSCHDAPRIWKLYGTTARKGPHTPERPHRLARLIVGQGYDPQPWQEAAAARNTAQLPKLLEHWRYIAATLKGRPAGDLIARARNYLAKMAPALSGRPADPPRNMKHGHDQTFHAACVLMKDFSLTEAQALEAIQDWNNRCEPPWSEAELRHKLRDAVRAPGASGRLVAESSNEPEAPATPQVDVATIDDLIAAGAHVRWLWPGWLQIGVLNAIAAVAGTGKTRFCADLVRRIRHGLTWPDGAAIELPPDALALWVVADNHHDEMVGLSQSFGIKDSIRINASKAHPYGGTTLDDPADIRALGARIDAVKPALVIVDTVGGATDLNLSKQEEAKAFYTPLQVLARQHSAAFLCLTHLNATGQFLGRRVLERVRVALRMDVPDAADDRRRLAVYKSNSKKPPALGVTMSDHGNEYDPSPPVSPDDPTPQIPGQRGPLPVQTQRAMEWLKQRLTDGPKRVSYTRTEAEFEGYSSKTLYKAVRLLGVEEFEAEGRKWWRLAEKTPPAS